MLDVCLPLAKGDKISPEVTEFRHDIPSRWLIERDWGEKRQGDFSDRLCILRTRALRRVTSPFWLALSNDCIVTAETLREALAWLEERPEWGGVGIWSHRQTYPTRDYHIPMRCSVIRTAATLGYEFRRRDGGDVRTCECSFFEQDIRKRGWVYQFHPMLTAQHLTGG